MAGKLRVEQVEETENGEIVHYINPADVTKVQPGNEGARHDRYACAAATTCNNIPVSMCLSAAFERLLQMPTVSFHMGAETCTIDLATASVSDDQLKKAEALANQVCSRTVPWGFVLSPLEEAKQLGLRKLPDVGKDELRLIDIADFDLCACGGTHVRSTAQIGLILVRKIGEGEAGIPRGIRVRRSGTEGGAQGFRNAYAGGDSLFGGYLRSTGEDQEVAGRDQVGAKAAAQAAGRVGGVLGGEAGQQPPKPQERSKLVKQVFADRDVVFVKLLAQKVVETRVSLRCWDDAGAADNGALARSQNVDVDVSALMKEAMAARRWPRWREQRSGAGRSAGCRKRTGVAGSIAAARLAAT